jgi:hypothetical protein
MRGALSRAPLQQVVMLRSAELPSWLHGAPRSTHVGIPLHYLEHAHSNVSSA